LEKSRAENKDIHENEEGLKHLTDEINEEDQAAKIERSVLNLVNTELIWKLS